MSCGGKAGGSSGTAAGCGAGGGSGPVAQPAKRARASPASGLSLAWVDGDSSFGLLRRRRGTLRGIGGSASRLRPICYKGPSHTAGSMPTDPLFYLIGVPAVFLISLGRGAFGGGLAILGVPLLALAVDPVTATFMMAPIVSASDPFTVWAFPAAHLVDARPEMAGAGRVRWALPGRAVCRQGRSAHRRARHLHRHPVVRGALFPAQPGGAHRPHAGQSRPGAGLRRP